jgi:hypothetical protein
MSGIVFVSATYLSHASHFVSVGMGEAAVEGPLISVVDNSFLFVVDDYFGRFTERKGRKGGLPKETVRALPVREILLPGAIPKVFAVWLVPEVED